MKKVSKKFPFSTKIVAFDRARDCLSILPFRILIFLFVARSPLWESRHPLNSGILVFTGFASSSRFKMSMIKMKVSRLNRAGNAQRNRKNNFLDRTFFFTEADQVKFWDRWAAPPCLPPRKESFLGADEQSSSWVGRRKAGPEGRVVKKNNFQNLNGRMERFYSDASAPEKSLENLFF